MILINNFFCLTSWQFFTTDCSWHMPKGYPSWYLHFNPKGRCIRASIWRPRNHCRANCWVWWIQRSEIYVIKFMASWSVFGFALKNEKFRVFGFGNSIWIFPKKGTLSNLEKVHPQRGLFLTRRAREGYVI